MNIKFHNHAVSCGIDMTGKVAVSVYGNLIGETLADDVINPENMETVLHTGQTLNAAALQWMRLMGCDYCVIEKGEY